jgi:hypothetical protein
MKRAGGAYMASQAPNRLSRSSTRKRLLGGIFGVVLGTGKNGKKTAL